MPIEKDLTEINASLKQIAVAFTDAIAIMQAGSAVPQTVASEDAIPGFIPQSDSAEDAITPEKKAAKKRVVKKRVVKKKVAAAPEAPVAPPAPPAPAAMPTLTDEEILAQPPKLTMGDVNIVLREVGAELGETPETAAQLSEILQRYGAGYLRDVAEVHYSSVIKEAKALTGVTA